VVRLWDLDKGDVRHELREGSGWIRSLAFSPDGRTLASAGVSAVQLWDPVMGQRRAILREHTSALNAVAFSPDGTTLATGSWDRTVHVWATEGKAAP
jgi:WD40 repeat protein